MKRTIALWLSIMLCLLLAACSQDSSDLLKVPVSANDCKGKNYQDVVNDISAAGFVNIQAKTIEDLVTGWLTKDGEVEEVTIDGDGSFRAGDTFDKTAAIIVSIIPFRARTRRLQPIRRDTQKQVRPLKITALRQRSGLRQANMPIV